MRLYQVGSLEEAKTNAEKALKYARELCKDRPDEFQNKLIDCLEAWAVVASGFGLLEECRQAREEAINLLLGQSFRDGEDKLAQCLNNLSGTLAALSDIAGAIRCSKKAVRLYRKLVRQRRSSTETNFRSGLQAFVDDLRPALADALTAIRGKPRDSGNVLLPRRKLTKSFMHLRRIIRISSFITSRWRCTISDRPGLTSAICREGFMK
jgi:tetratricopeptide (TPR) repeat protein